MNGLIFCIVGVPIAFIVARINFGTIDPIGVSTCALTILRGINDEEGLKCTSNGKKIDMMKKMTMLCHHYFLCCV